MDFTLNNITIESEKSNDNQADRLAGYGKMISKEISDLQEGTENE